MSTCVDAFVHAKGYSELRQWIKAKAAFPLSIPLSISAAGRAVRLGKVDLSHSEGLHSHTLEVSLALDEINDSTCSLLGN